MKIYFNKQKHDFKTSLLLKNINSVEVIITDNENEAFILENTLIKQFSPKYNIDLKDAKSYAYLEVTKKNTQD